ncbi:MAG: MFS transporter [Burkholderiaceae bacterium]
MTDSERDTTLDISALTRQEKRVLAWMCLIIAINQLGFGALLPVLPLYAQSFGVSASAIGMTIAVYGLARFLIAMPCGQMADTLGRRPTLAAGGLISAVGNLWCAFASSYAEFIMARFVSGAGAGIVLTVGIVILTDISTPARRGRMMAMYQGCFLFAVGIGPLPGGLLAENFSLATPFASYGIAAAAVAIVAWFTIPETRTMGESARRSQTSVATPAAPMLERIRALASYPGFALICMLGFVHAVVRTGGLFNVVPIVAAGQLGLSAAQIGAGFAAGSVLGLVAAYPGGALADRYGRKAVIVPSSLLVSASMASFFLAPSFAWFVFACLVWGVATSISAAAPSAYAAESAPPGMTATAISSQRMLSDAGYVIGPIGLGLLVDWQNERIALLAAALMIAIAGIAFARYAPESFAGHAIQTRRST